MNLTCPRCHTKLTIPDLRVPPGGAWAKCPKCKEKFFVKPPVVLVDETPGNQLGTGATSLKTRDAASLKLLNHLKKRKGPEAETSLEPLSGDIIEVIVFPEAVVNYQLYILFIALLGVGLVVLLIIGFVSAKPKADVPSPAKVHRVIPEYGPQGVKADLISLRSDFHSRRIDHRKVTYQSPESRIFKYSLSHLAPDLCQEITSVRTWTNAPYHRFTAEAECLEPGWDAPRLEVIWKKGQAIISFLDHPDQLELVVDLNRTNTPESPVTLKPKSKKEGFKLDLL